MSSAGQESGVRKVPTLPKNKTADKAHTAEERHLLDLPFDHYQRYALSQRLVDLIWPDRKAPLRILDVGGHSGSLKHFLPDDEIVILDILPPPEFTHLPDLPFLHDGYFLGSGTSLPFADGTFDFVTAHDTLEHLPQGTRRQFLREMIRVSRGHLILNGPVDAGDGRNVDIERRVLDLGRHALNWENPYLQEHLEHGIPTASAMENLFRESNIPFQAIPNGSARFWVLMMALRHYLLALPNPEGLQTVIDRVFNSLVSSRDFSEPCYRTAYVAAVSPDGALALQDLPESVLRDASQAQHYPIGDDGLLDTLLQALEEHALRVRTDISVLQEWVSQRDAALAGLDLTVQHLRAEQEARDAELDELRRHLAQSQSKLDAVQQELSAMRRSLGWRALEAYRRPIRWLFPRGSRRAAPYRAAVKTIDRSVSLTAKLPALARSGHRLAARSRHVIRTEGWRAFARRARRKGASLLRRRPVPTTPLPITYAEWITATEPGAAELALQGRASALLPYQPLISIITPVWNPGPSLLRKTIESVREQTYGNWELCLADGGSTSPEVRAILEEFDARDTRIKVQFLGENKGISGNSNAALQLASGEYVAFLDHTDTLSPNALWEVCALLNRDPGADCIYSDHDLISEEDMRHQPLFKPEFSPEMLLSANYATHFYAIRKRLLDDLGGLRSALDGAQDWDLMLRVAEVTDRFSHIPKILYHWRADSTSAVTAPENKPHALKAQEHALQEHIDRTGAGANIMRTGSGWPRVRWRLSTFPKVSIIIPTRHNRKLLSACLQSIARSSYSNWEAVVVESAGQTPDREKWHRAMQQRVGYKLLWWDKPFNYSSVNNLGARQSGGELLLFLNDDTQALSVDWLEEMVGWLQRRGVGAVGAQLVSPNGRLQHGGDVIGLNGFADHLFTGCQPNEWTMAGSVNWYRNVTAVTGACLLITRALFDEIGGFNENFILCGSDVELCIRIRRRNLRIVCTPYARVLHHERATRGKLDIGEDAFTSYWHYQSYLIGGDPFFNPNLSRFSSRPTLRHPDEPRPAVTVARALQRNLTPYKQGVVKMEEEAAALVEWCQIAPDEVEANHRLHEAHSTPFAIRSINWFIPDFESPFYGGLHTILRFADLFTRKYGVQNRFIVLGTGPEQFVRSGLRAAFPSLEDSEIHICSLNEEEINRLPQADACIATLWVTAFAVSKFRNTKRKFYMVQDYEPVFYPAGTLFALSEATYRLGLYGLCNTFTLRDIYEKDYGGKGFGFVPAVDTALFHPPQGPRHEGDTMMLFLYGRPGHWRNCYELAIAALRRLKQRLKRKIRIVAAGSWVAVDDSESAYLVDNLGLLDYKDTADLYRQCDVGLTLSVSKHPSYLPLELMASGALVVSNYNPSGFWLLHNEENCLLAEPTAESLCAALERALTDDALRDRLAERAIADIRAKHSDWPAVIDSVYRYMCNPEGKQGSPLEA